MVTHRDLLRVFDKLSAPLRRQIRMTVARGVVRLIDDAARMQRLQVSILSEETRDRAEHFQPYGFTAHPHPGAEAVVLHPFGQRAHPLVVMVDDRRYRMTDLVRGESAVYTDEGQYVHLKRGREIHLVAGDSSIVMTPSGITITAPAVDIEKAGS